METCPHCSQPHESDVLFCPSTGKAISVSRIQEGALIEGKYRVIQRIASGGMGAIYEVEHSRIGKHFAMKLLLPELAHSAEITQRFEREARAASAIGHPNIIEITDMGTTEDGLQFIVMELLRGEDLGGLLDREGVLDPTRAVSLASQILMALSAAHEAGIIHRDLKPENVFVSPGTSGAETVKLLDFGISKIAGSDEAKLRLTSTGLILGTPFYMSPEQAKGAKEIDHRSDLFSAGVILYQMLTGRRPFVAESLNSLIYQILSGRFPRPSELNDDLPGPLENVVLKSLALEPDERFQTATEFREALLGKRSVTRPMAPQPILPTGSTPAEGLMPTLPQEAGMVTPAYPAGGRPEAHTEASQPASTSGRSWLLPVVLAGGIVAAGLVAGVVFLGRRSNERKATPSGSGTSRAAMRVDGAVQRSEEPRQKPSIRVVVDVHPKTAEMRLDGKKVDENPFTLVRDNRKHNLSVSAPGHQSRTIVFQADVSQRLQVSLDPVKTAASERPRTGRRRRRTRTSRASRARPARPAADTGRKKVKVLTDI